MSKFSYAKNVKRLMVVGVIAGLLGSFSEMAIAFKQGIHETITEKVLPTKGFDTDSADEAGDANWNTDIFEPHVEAAHADNNNLDGASARLVSKRRDIGDSLNICKRADALDSLGQALHTVQDVYSHSNAVDNNIRIDNILGMQHGTARCALPGFAPDGLVTGYFSLAGFLAGIRFPLVFSQCTGIPDDQCCHRDMNKDNASQRNGAKHAAAVTAAETATSNYLDLIESDIRERFTAPDQATQLIKILKRKQRTQVFVIDDTGSMSDDIAGVQAVVNSFVDGIIAGEEAPTLGLVSFKDSVNNRGLSCDVNAVRDQVNALFADGGDDCPEASNAALLSAINSFPAADSSTQLRGGRVLLATDASAGDAALGPRVTIAAARKGVSIDAILTGDCVPEDTSVRSLLVAERPSENGPFATAAATPIAAVTGGDPLTSLSARTQLRALTEQTGGVLFNVERLEVDDVVPTLLELGATDSAALLSRRVQVLSGAPTVIDIPVDDTLTDKVTFMLTASRAGALPTFTLRRPDGTLVVNSDTDVAFRSLSSVVSYVITRPSIGRWTVQIEGEDSFVFRAFGATPFRINGLRLLAPPEIAPRDEVDLVPIDGQPAMGDTITAELRFTSAPRSAAVFLRRLDGTVIQELVVNAVDGSRRFSGELVIPGETFIIEATGVTADGAEFTREISMPIIPQTVVLKTTPELAAAIPDSTASFQINVINTASAAATYQLTASSELGWSISVPATVDVSAGGSTTVTMTVDVPSDAILGQRNTITMAAEDSAAPRVRNSTTVAVEVATLDVVINNPPAANAGVDQNVERNSTVTLDGTASSDTDGFVMSFAWMQTAGNLVTLTGADTATPSFTTPGTAQTLTFQLTVADNEGLSAIDTVSVVINNPPVANAGADQTVKVNDTVTLDGRVSNDPDGPIANFAWVQTAGDSVSLNSADTATPSFTAPNTGQTLTFQLTVTDSDGATSVDNVVITVQTANGGGGGGCVLAPTAEFDPLLVIFLVIGGIYLVCRRRATSLSYQCI